MTEPLLRMTLIGKRFPGVQALDNVGLEVLPGEIHALLGENGAGKSTLLKILSGAQQPDSGTIEFGGQRVTMASAARRPAPRHCHHLPGVHAGAQHDNRRERLHRARTRSGRFRELAKNGGGDARDHYAARPAVAADVHRSRLKRRRAADGGDRPCAVDEVAADRHGRANIGTVVERGRRSSFASSAISRRRASVSFSSPIASKRLWQICDRYTVLRDGQLVGSGSIADTSIDNIIRLMVGRQVNALFAHRERTAAATSRSGSRA